MSVEVIRDFHGRIIARIETMPNGNKIVRDFSGKILGRYDAAANVTRDFFGQIVARGDAVTMLIK